MARIRSVKPELRRDLTVAEWPRETRYAWVLLWGYLDDHGRGLDDLRLLTADLFPLDRDVTEKKLDRWLAVMAEGSMHGSAPLCRYEVRGRRFLHAPKWGKSQRVSHPQESTLPPCPTHDLPGNDSGTIPESVRNDSVAAPEPFQTSRAPEGLGVKGAREQGSKGAREEPATALVPIADRPPGAGTVVAAYVDAVRSSAGPLDNRAKGRIAKDAAALLADGAPVALLIDAAQRLAVNGYADLGAEARRLHGERSVTPIRRPSASEAAANAALEAGARVAARHAAQEGA